MVKIGRNETCPCGSGKKYKRCCGRNSAVAAASPPQDAFRSTLMAAVERLQQDAAAGRVVCRDLGVFFLFTLETGDAWVLEMTDQDAIQVAEDGRRMDAPIDENPETIEIHWSYTFALKEKKLELTAYSDGSSFFVDGAPTRELNAAMRRIKKRFSQKQLDQVHLDNVEKNIS